MLAILRNLPSPKKVDGTGGAKALLLKVWSEMDWARLLPAYMRRMEDNVRSVCALQGGNG